MAKKAVNIHTPEYKRTASHPHFHSICPKAEEELAKVCQEGDDHYGEWNWTNLGDTSVERFKRDAVRHLKGHLNLYLQGDRSEPHLGKVMWGCMAMIHFDSQCKHEEALKEVEGTKK